VRVKKGPFRRRRNMRIKPAQENVRDQQAGAFEFDGDAYRDDRFYPEELVDVSPPMFMDGYRVLCLHVRPFQYNPTRGLLHCYTNIEVAIQFRKEVLTAGPGKHRRQGGATMDLPGADPQPGGFRKFSFQPRTHGI
jgi:hypothetical protein